MLIFSRFTLALALVHTENEYLPVLVNLRARSREMSYLPERQLLPQILLPSKVQALTINHSTWLKLPEECEGPHFRRAVLPTSTSTRSGVDGGCFSSPETPGEGEGRARATLSAPAALSGPLPSPGSLQLFHWQGLERAFPLLTLNFTRPALPTWVRPLSQWNMEWNTDRVPVYILEEAGGQTDKRNMGSGPR